MYSGIIIQIVCVCKFGFTKKKKLANDKLSQHDASYAPVQLKVDHFEAFNICSAARIRYVNVLQQIHRPICRQLLWNIPWGIKMVSVCTDLLAEEGRVSASVDTRL